MMISELKWAACRTHGREEKDSYFWSEDMKGNNHLEGLGEDGRQY
jgi:hypothetical protein